MLAAAQARAGQIEVAKEAWIRGWEVQPLDLPSYFASVRRAIKRDEDGENYIDAMRLAGGPSE